MSGSRSVHGVDVHACTGGNVGCRQLPDEEKQGTHLSAALKTDHSRGTGDREMAGDMVGRRLRDAVFYLLVALVVKCIRGSLNGGPPSPRGGVVHLVGLAAVAALGTAFSTPLTYGAAASMCYVVVGSSFCRAAAHPPGDARRGGGRPCDGCLPAVYYLLPHFELFDMRLRIVHEWGMVPWATFAILLSYGAVLTALLLFVSWLGYRRKHFEKGRRVVNAIAARHHIIAAGVLLSLAALAFSLACRLTPDPSFAPHVSMSMLGRLLGESRRAIGDDLCEQADRYFHRGVGHSRKAVSMGFFQYLSDKVQPRRPGAPVGRRYQ